MADETGAATTARPTSADYKPTFEAVNPDEIPQQVRAGKTDELLTAFLEAGVEAAEIKGQSKTFMTSLNNYRKSHPEINSKVVWKSVGGRVFFYNAELMKARQEREAAAKAEADAAAAAEPAEDGASE